jgi:hypothetical protein
LAEALSGTHIYGMLSILICMKTTVELPDSLLREAKRLALREGTTVKALIERGLRTVVKAQTSRPDFTLRRASFRGDGLVSGRTLRDWDAIRDAIYTERGT